MVKLAIFDVDGTLFDGNLGIEFLKVLIRKGLFDKDIGQKIFVLNEKYKEGKIEKSILIDKIYKLYAVGMTNQKTSEVIPASLETWKGVSGNLFDFVKPLVKFLKEKGFEIILLSGSPIEMIKILAKKLEIYKTVAGMLEIKDGVYTGNIISYPGSSEQKVEALGKLVRDEKIDVDWKNSIGMGDNERELGIFKKVGMPFALEPNEKLTNEAKRLNFTIANRNNILELVKSKLGN